MKPTNNKLAWSVILAFAASTAAYAQDKTAEIDKLFNWVTPETPGCVCAVSYQGKMVVNRAYGQADLERNVALTTSSVFDAASLTKQFVAAAVLLLVEENRLSLSDDVRKYIPELHDYGYKITLDHLLTHTSGLRDWTGIAMLTDKSADALTLVLRQRNLNFVPGEEWSYSNSGYVLLKEIVGRITGTSFADFAQKRLFGPLGMKSTAYQNDLRDVIKNRALAYEKENGTWKLNMKLDDDRGGGGALMSTASDLLIWNEALTNASLGKFVTEKLQEPATLNNGRKLGYARGLFLNTSRAGKTVGHTGGSAGYGSLLTRIPDQGLSIAILCNSGDAGDRGAFARRILDIFVPASNTKTAESKTPGANANPDAAVTAGPELSTKAGLFFNESTGAPLRLAANNGKLSIAGGPTLLAVDKDRFRNPNGNLTFLSGDEFELRFLSQDQFELRSMEGNITNYRRAQPFTPTSSGLKAFAGRYANKELGTIFQIEPQGEGLVLRLEHSPEKALPFKPVAPDTFQAGGMTIHFIRNKTGKIEALDYSNMVLRNVKFTQLSNDTALIKNQGKKFDFNKIKI